MLYTRKGDDGTTGLFHCKQRLSKSSLVAEALGALDETNSFLGVIKSKAGASLTQISGLSLGTILHQIQENLFIIQAETAGADKTIQSQKITDLENMIAQIEKEIPPITSFTIPGVSLESAEIDLARTLVRKTERRVVAMQEEGVSKVSANTLIYLNRLSSLLFALARLSAHKSGINESAPSYK